MNPETIDLHSHSIYSDGTKTPKELVDQAAENGLKALALTDHDTVDGIPEFLESARAIDYREAIPGVEISTIYSSREVHIVGLFIDHNNAELLAFLSQIQEKRVLRNELMVQKLASIGYEVDFDQIKEAAQGEIIGRPHFANYLFDNYEFEDTREVFDKLLKRGAPGFVGRTLPNPAEAIDIIHKAGGIAIWAHPIYRKSKERSWCRRMLKFLVPAGLDAIEAYYTQFNEKQTQIVKDLALEFDIALAGGSDYHGENHPEIFLGIGYGELQVPASILPELMRLAKK